MGKITGFMEFTREEPSKLPVKKRLLTYAVELGVEPAVTAVATLGAAA